MSARPRLSPIIRGTSILVALVLFWAPLLHAFHLIAEPHIFCPVHGHLESIVDRGTEESDAPDRSEHEDEDLSCIAAAISAVGEEPGPCLVPLLTLLCAGTIASRPSSVITVRDLTSAAPKQSPPTEATIS
jgi:hypothetical protein